MGTASSSDKGSLTTMLVAAGISYIELATDIRRGVPANSTSFIIGDYIDNTDKRFMGQTYRGGYSGFFTEMVFDPEGTLIAVWAWE